MKKTWFQIGWRIAIWAPALLWYGLIWSFSAQPATASGNVSDGLLHRLLAELSPAYVAAAREVQIAAMEILSFYERKAAHMVLYFVLALLIWLAIFWWGKRPTRVGAALLLCAVLAALDEYHQTLVPGRSGEIRDVLVDLGGSLLAMAALALLIRIARLREEDRFRWSGSWPMAAGIAVLIFFATAQDLAVLPPFAFRALNGGIDIFAPLDEVEKMALLRAASPILRETLSLAACALLGCCAACGALMSGGRRPMRWAALTAMALSGAAALALDFPVTYAIGLAGLGVALVFAGWWLAVLFDRAVGATKP